MNDLPNLSEKGQYRDFCRRISNKTYDRIKGVDKLISDTLEREHSKVFR